jgi:DNA excision repair protein ERCC-2
LTIVNFECIVQKNNLNDEEKELIIEKFKTTNNTKFGFFVMGGVFSEGIDFIGDALSGVIIVGVGLPLVCDENNILKEYFEEKYPGKGFDYAYVYPGFTKVIQAVGRVIRDEKDQGVAVLMDNRFNHIRYRELMPPHWKNIKVVTNNFQLKKNRKK